MTAVAPATGTADQVWARVSTEVARATPESTAVANLEKVQAVEKPAVVEEAPVEAEAVGEQVVVQVRE